MPALRDSVRLPPIWKLREKRKHEFEPLYKNEPAVSDPNYEKHVYCDGARFHVLSWAGLVGGGSVTFCSHRKCIINKGTSRDHMKEKTDD